MLKTPNLKKYQQEPRFRELYKKGLQKNIAHYTVSEEILSVLVFYLCSRNKRLLGKLMHTVVPSLDAVTRRSFRRLVLRTQLYLLQKAMLEKKF